MPKKNTGKVVVDDTLKFAWSYLILNGKLTDGKWSYYGGCWEDKPRLNKAGAATYVSWETRMKEMEDFRAKVLKVGIDWEKSGVPEVQHEGYFTGTFDSHQGECLATLGKLVLLNGEEFLLGSNDDDAAHLAETAREMMRKPGESEVEKFAKKLK